MQFIEILHTVPTKISIPTASYKWQNLKSVKIEKSYGEKSVDLKQNDILSERLKVSKTFSMSAGPFSEQKSITIRYHRGNLWTLRRSTEFCRCRIIPINDRLNTLLTSVHVGLTQSLLLTCGRLRVCTQGPCSRPVFRNRVYWVFIRIYCDERYAFHILITYRQNLAIKSTAPADALSVCRSCCIFHSNYNEPTSTSWHLLHDIPDVTIVRQSHQSVWNRLIMNKRT